MSINITTLVARLTLYLGVFLVSLAAIYRGGNRWLPLTLLEWLSLALLGLMVWMWWQPDATAQRKGLTIRHWALALICTSPVWIAGLQLMTLPPGWLEWRTATASVAPFFRESGGAVGISLLPQETLRSALSGLPLVCCFVMALFLKPRHVNVLLKVWVFSAVFQALLGLLQLGIPTLAFSERMATESQGSFGSRNSFANYLAMLLPVLLLWSLTSRQSASSKRLDRRLTNLVWSAFVLLFLAALLASSSRAGIATGVLAVLATWALLTLHKRVQKSTGLWRWVQSLLPLAMLGFVMASGGWDWLARYETGDPARLLNWSASWQAMNVFWPIGSGLGTFGSVFPAFQPAELGVWFVNFAHNDYLQLLMEGGVLVIPVAAALLALVVQRAVYLASAWQSAGWNEGDTLAAACGLGFLAQALHAWVDYPWRIPATAMLGAFLLGVYLRHPETGRMQARET